MPNFPLINSVLEKTCFNNTCSIWTYITILGKTYFSILILTSCKSYLANTYEDTNKF